MNEMEIKAIKELQKYYRLKNRSIPNLKNKLIYLNNEIEGVQAVEIKDMPRSKSNRPNYYRESLIDEKIEVERSIKNNGIFVEYIEKALSGLNSIERELLIECYGKEKQERVTDISVCEKLAISLSTFYRRKKDVVKQFATELNGI